MNSDNTPPKTILEIVNDLLRQENKEAVLLSLVAHKDFDAIFELYEKHHPASHLLPSIGEAILFRDGKWDYFAGMAMAETQHPKTYDYFKKFVGYFHPEGDFSKVPSWSLAQIGQAYWDAGHDQDAVRFFCKGKLDKAWNFLEPAFRNLLWRLWEEEDFKEMRNENPFVNTLHRKEKYTAFFSNAQSTAPKHKI